MLSQPSDAATWAAVLADEDALEDFDVVGRGVDDCDAEVEGLALPDVDVGWLHAATVRVRQAAAAMARGFMCPYVSTQPAIANEGASGASRRINDRQRICEALERRRDLRTVH